MAASIVAGVCGLGYYLGMSKNTRASQLPELSKVNLETREIPAALVERGFTGVSTMVTSWGLGAGLTVLKTVSTVKSLTDHSKE